MTWHDYDPLTAAWNWLRSLAGVLTEPGSPFWWPTIIAAALAFLAIGFFTRASFREMRRTVVPLPGRSFLRQTCQDAILFVVNAALPFLLAPVFFLLSAVGATLAVALLTPVFGAPEYGARLNHPLAMVAAALIPFATTDLSLYWTHRFFHRLPLLWRAHRLHHEPPMLTPLTAFRFWPQEQVVHIAGGVFMNGVGLGVVASLFGARVDPATLLGVNAFALLWNVAFSHLRHSHIALPFPRWLSYVLVSPHMHQAHHSADVVHHDKNYATVFALWDWMFGTLYLPKKGERFRFGVDDAAPATAEAPLPPAEPKPAR
ncbi:sterol desaturase family protein [Roseomonas sp. HJA6]|uniref:Sterol desaturase family protein n=1 Tax=Roseomonas alba TaxID=2846776 RepID=A0ABS7A4J3_9PROT|nr:sterol desaturase family protein [Neoroseomonas alba]MBW6396260.1 sterol desaturase family protein [Neoroseomonas alba]